jgi:hypothetical protein
LTFGTLNVVDQSHTQYVVHINAKSPEYVVLDTAAQSHKRYHVGAVHVDHTSIAPVGFAPKSQPTTLFLQSVIDVIVLAPDTTIASREYCPFHALVDVWITPVEFIIIYVVTLAPTVRVHPAYCHSDHPTR